MGDSVQDKLAKSLEERYGMHDVIGLVSAPYRYIAEHSGKKMRSLLVDAFQVWLEVPDTSLEMIKAMIERLHTSSLLIDDIEDDSKLRRGRPVAHSIYGEAVTINSANLEYFNALDLCLELKSPDAVRVFTEEMIRLHVGQGLDIYWRVNNQCPSLEQYKEMVIDKTGGLFRLAIRLMQGFSKSKEDFTRLGNLLGLFYQIRDDWINLVDPAYMKNKGYLEDLTEGKFSFPIIHCIQADLTDTRLLNVLRQRTESPEIKNYAREWMIEKGSLEHSRETLMALACEIREEVARLGGNPRIEAFVDALSIELFEHPTPLSSETFDI